MLSIINRRTEAPMIPARMVPKVQARRVYSPAPHSTENQRSMPPMSPAIKPEGQPKTSGAASRTFRVAPFAGIPNSVARQAAPPKTTPIISCLTI